MTDADDFKCRPLRLLRLSNSCQPALHLPLEFRRAQTAIEQIDKLQRDHLVRWALEVPEEREELLHISGELCRRAWSAECEELGLLEKERGGREFGVHALLCNKRENGERGEGIVGG